MLGLPQSQHVDFPTTPLAKSHVGASRDTCNLLKYRLFPVLVAIWTYPMRWFGTASLFFYLISINPMGTQLLKPIFLLLSFPCFKISHFCFKRAYTLNQFRLLLLGSQKDGAHGLSP